MTWRDDVLATWETERLKTLQVWQSFADDDLTWRPPDAQQRGRSVREHMVHQCISEDRWCSGMLGINLGLPPLPDNESRLAFLALYSDRSAKRLAFLQQQDDAWWNVSTRFFDTDRSRLWVVMRRLLHTAHHRGQLTAYLRCLERQLWSTYGPTADTGGLNQHAAPTIYAYTDDQSLLADPTGIAAVPLPGPPADRPVSERPSR
jgi:uncharacterized damage-inducible protein DinB